MGPQLKNEDCLQLHYCKDIALLANRASLAPNHKRALRESYQFGSTKYGARLDLAVRQHMWTDNRACDTMATIKSAKGRFNAKIV